MKQVRYLPSARKSLVCHANMAPRITKALAEYAAGSGRHAGQVKALRGVALLRLRVGDFRVLFTETDNIINVVDVGPRSHVYD